MIFEPCNDCTHRRIYTKNIQWQPSKQTLLENKTKTKSQTVRQTSKTKQNKTKRINNKPVGFIRVERLNFQRWKTDRSVFKKAIFFWVKREKGMIGVESTRIKVSK